MTVEIQKLIDHCLDYAKDLLEDTREFYPFGAYVGNEGNVHPLEFEYDKKNMPTNGHVIEWLEKFCSEEIENNRIRAYCIIFDVNIQLKENTAGSDAICFDITSKTDSQIPLFYIPYQIDKSGTPSYQEMFAVKRRNTNVQANNQKMERA